jgi:hypothetical protein
MGDGLARGLRRQSERPAHRIAVATDLDNGRGDHDRCLSGRTGDPAMAVGRSLPARRVIAGSERAPPGREPHWIWARVVGLRG